MLEIPLFGGKSLHSVKNQLHREREKQFAMDVSRVLERKSKILKCLNLEEYLMTSSYL